VARTVPMPPRSELPKGARRDFVEELRRYYRGADRPPLRRISEMIDNHADPAISKVTATPETVRRMITGKVLPVDVARVRAVFMIFCELGGVDPDGMRWDRSYGDDEGETNWQHLRRLWDEALEEQPVSRALVQPPARSEDPWATDIPTQYSDEPPF
jgi:hypothetical protein